MVFGIGHGTQQAKCVGFILLSRLGFLCVSKMWLNFPWHICICLQLPLTYMRHVTANMQYSRCASTCMYRSLFAFILFFTCTALYVHSCTSCQVLYSHVLYCMCPSKHLFLFLNGRCDGVCLAEPPVLGQWGDRQGCVSTPCWGAAGGHVKVKFWVSGSTKQPPWGV